jgi:hypothetical protein
LEELKKRKSQRSDDTAKVKASASANLEDYIDGLLSEPAAAAATGTTPTPPTDRKTAAEANEGSTAATQVGGADAATSSSSMPSNANNVIAEPAPAPPLRTVETFTMGTQTEVDDFPESPETEQDEDDAAEEREKRAGGGEEDLGELPAVQQTVEEQDPKLLSAEELEKQVTSAPSSSIPHRKRWNDCWAHPCCPNCWSTTWAKPMAFNDRTTRILTGVVFCRADRYTNVPNGLLVATLPIWTGPLCTGTLFCLPITCHLPQWLPPRSRKVPPLYRPLLPTAHYLVR